MRAVDYSPYYRATVGFDRMFDLLDSVAGQTAGNGYPPYNIERLGQAADKTESLRITLAVAGFSREELEVTVEENELVIRGRQEDESARQYLHRGIAARQFQKTFVLAEGIEVVGADLKDGLLSVDLARPQNARVARQITINGRG